ncbi:MAG: DnaJ domain-containing protein [Gammaproteobacteria bacterium]
MMRNDNLVNEMYSVLDLTPTATDAELKGKYRKLALIHRPDTSSPDQSDQFMQIKDAYEYLTEYREAQRPKQLSGMKRTREDESDSKSDSTLLRRGNSRTYGDAELLKSGEFKLNAARNHQSENRYSSAHYGIRYSIDCCFGLLSDDNLKKRNLCISYTAWGKLYLNKHPANSKLYSKAEAENCFKKALEYVSSISDKAVEDWKKIAELFFLWNQADKAVEKFEEVILQLTTQINSDGPTDQAQLNKVKCSLAYYLSLQAKAYLGINQPAKALSALQLAILHIESLKDVLFTKESRTYKLFLAECHKDCASAYAQLNNSQSAYNSIKLAEDILYTLLKAADFFAIKIVKYKDQYSDCVLLSACAMQKGEISATLKSKQAAQDFGLAIELRKILLQSKYKSSDTSHEDNIRFIIQCYIKKAKVHLSLNSFKLALETESEVSAWAAKLESPTLAATSGALSKIEYYKGIAYKNLGQDYYQMAVDSFKSLLSKYEQLESKEMSVASDIARAQEELYEMYLMKLSATNAKETLVLIDAIMKFKNSRIATEADAQKVMDYQMQIAIHLKDKGMVLKAIQKYDEAVSCETQAVEMFDKLLKLTHSEPITLNQINLHTQISICHSNLARIYKNMKQYPNALTELDLSLKGWKLIESHAANNSTCKSNIKAIKEQQLVLKKEAALASTDKPASQVVIGATLFQPRETASAVQKKDKVSQAVVPSQSH